PPAMLSSRGMELWYADLWTAWDFAVLVVGGVAAGFGVSTLTGLFLKGGEFARVRDALARAVGDPEERRRLSPRMSIRLKLPSILAGACLVPIMFAVLVALDRGTSSLEAFAQRWTQQVLAGLPADADAEQIGAVQQLLSSEAVPIPVTLVALDGADPLLPAAVAQQVARGAPHSGIGSSSLRAGAISSWRKLADGTVWIAAVSAADLYARGTVSPLLLAALVAASLGVPAILAGGVARDIAMPVPVLRPAAERLATGDLRPAATFESEDEFGELARSF